MKGALFSASREKAVRISGRPKGISRIHAGDILVMYGTLPRLEELDNRKIGKAGDRAHQDVIVALQQELKAQTGHDELNGEQLKET